MEFRFWISIAVTVVCSSYVHVHIRQTYSALPLGPHAVANMSRIRYRLWFLCTYLYELVYKSVFFFPNVVSDDTMILEPMLLAYLA